MLLDPSLRRAGRRRRRSSDIVRAGAGQACRLTSRWLMRSRCIRSRRAGAQASISAGPPGLEASAARARRTATPLSARQRHRYRLRLRRRHGPTTSRRAPITALRSPAAAPTGIGASARQRTQRPFQAGVYGTTHFGPAYLSGALAFANHWFTTNRIAVGDESHRELRRPELRGARRSRLKLRRAGHRLHRRCHAVRGLAGAGLPYPELQRDRSLRRRFWAQLQCVNATDTRSELGDRFDNLTVLGRHAAHARPLGLRADWVSNPALGAVFQALPGSNFTVNGAAPPKNAALTTAGAELHLSANWTAIGEIRWRVRLRLANLCRHGHGQIFVVSGNLGGSEEPYATRAGGAVPASASGSASQMTRLRPLRLAA